MMDGKWTDARNLSRALNMIDEIKGLEARGFTTDEIMEYLPEAEIEWLKEFFSAFVVDLQHFIEAMAKIAVDFLNAVAENLTGILETMARAQKDGRTRAFGAPAVAFQAPAIPTSSLGGYGLPEDLIPGTPFAMPGVNVHNDGIANQINRQLDSLQQPSVARRRRFE